MKIKSIEYDGNLYKVIKTKAPVMSSHRGRTWDILDINAKFYHESGMFVTRIWPDAEGDYLRSDWQNWKYDNRNLPVDDWYKFKF